MMKVATSRLRQIPIVLFFMFSPSAGADSIGICMGCMELLAGGGRKPDTFVQVQVAKAPSRLDRAQMLGDEVAR